MSISFNKFIYKTFIPNPCDYHYIGIENNMIFNLFFDMNSNTGYHPEPNNFNFIFTLLIGVLIGFMIWKSVNKK